MMVSTRSSTKRQMSEAKRPIETPQPTQEFTSESEEEVAKPEMSLQRNEPQVLLPPQHNSIQDLKLGRWADKMTSFIFEKNTTKTKSPDMKVLVSRFLREGAVREPDFRTLLACAVEKRLHTTTCWRRYCQAIMVQMMGKLMEGDDRCLYCQSGRGPFATCVAMKDVKFGCCANCIWKEVRLHDCKHYGKQTTRIALKLCTDTMH